MRVKLMPFLDVPFFLRFRQDGKGLRNYPFRYGLGEKKDEWRKDECARHLMPELMEKKEDQGQGEPAGG
jgi:hypothetical protein